MMGELVLNLVEGKEFFTVKMVSSAFIPNMSAFRISIPTAQAAVQKAVFK
jgi:hypothetical protein